MPYRGVVFAPDHYYHIYNRAVNGSLLFNSENYVHCLRLVKRYRQRSSPRGQLWLLNGGPGGSGADFEAVWYLFVAMAPDLELYFIDHRGTGRSARLGCPGAEATWSEGSETIVDEEWSECRDEVSDTWGDGLNGFSTTAAARDLGAGAGTGSRRTRLSRRTYGTARSAVVRVGLQVHAASPARGLAGNRTFRATNPRGADLIGQTHRTARTAVGAVALEVDASSSAVKEPGLAHALTVLTQSAH